jgi:hypothetical protein
MWTYTGLRIREGTSWKNNEGITHPAQWSSKWTLEEKTSAGLVWVDDPVQYDSRFYTGDGTAKALDDVNAVDDDGNAILDVDGVQVVTRGLKWNAIQNVKAQASGLLQPTDWMVIKAAEVADYTVPSEVTTYRAAVRTASNTIETAINGVADHDAFMALYDTPLDAEGMPTGNAPINDWPNQI